MTDPGQETPQSATGSTAEPAEPVSLADVVGLPVMAADSAERLGEVKGFVVEQSGRRVVKVHVSGKRRKAMFVPWSALTVGPDIVMVSAAGAVESGSDDRDHDTANGDLTLVGARVLDTTGRERGTVTAGEVEPVTGRVMELRANGVSVGPEQIHSLGHYALVIDAN